MTAAAAPRHDPAAEDAARAAEAASRMAAFRAAYIAWSGQGNLGTGLFIAGWHGTDTSLHDDHDYLAGRRARHAYERRGTEGGAP